MIINDTSIREKCFYCSKDVHPKHLQWRGEGGMLFLHIYCALALGYRLVRSAKRQITPKVDNPCK